MIRFFLYSLLIFSSMILHAQEYVNFSAFDFDDHSLQKIINPQTRLRAEPNLNSDIVDSLEVNSLVRIVENFKNYETIGQRTAPWYKVAYNKNGVQNTAFLWGGNIALGNIVVGRKDFLYGLVSTMTVYSEEFDMSFPELEAVLYAVENNNIIAKATFPMGSMENSAYGNFTYEENKDFKNVDGIFHISSGGEGCGIAGYYQPVFWSNNSFYVIPKLVNVSDADVFAHTEEYIYPDQSDIPNALIKTTEIYESDEGGSKTTNYKKEFFKWNGKELVSVREL